MQSLPKSTTQKNVAVLLVNLGSPISPDKSDVGRYLKEFLMDPYIIDVPYLLRYFLVNFMIVPKRSTSSASLYRKIWTAKGSPLIVNTEKLTNKVANLLKVPVVMAMRYGEPSIESGLKKLKKQGVDNLYVVPLYPQYAMSTTLTVNEEVERQINKHLSGVTVSTTSPFYEDEDYIRVLSASIKSQLADKAFDHLLFSYHGVPERHLRKTDPTGNHCLASENCCETPNKAHRFCYKHQCHVSTELVAQSLGLTPNQYSISFQSRLGKDPWIQPYTSDKIIQLAQSGIKKLAIVTPAFVSDCLETIEEIGMEVRKEFLQAGGDEFHRILCLNDDNDWADILAKWSKSALNL